MNIAAFSIPHRFCLFFFRENKTKEACARFCKIYILILINTNIFKIGKSEEGGKERNFIGPILKLDIIFGPSAAFVENAPIFKALIGVQQAWNVGRPEQI